jgi:hypothetical protein
MMEYCSFQQALQPSSAEEEDWVLVIQYAGLTYYNGVMTCL